MAKTPINSALAVQKQAGRERRPLPGGRAGARAEDAAAPEEMCPGGLEGPTPGGKPHSRPWQGKAPPESAPKLRS